jgi:hypothetical protein
MKANFTQFFLLDLTCQGQWTRSSGSVDNLAKEVSVQFDRKTSKKRNFFK